MMRSLGFAAMAMLVLFSKESPAQESDHNDTMVFYWDISRHVETAKMLATQAINSEIRQLRRISNHEVPVLILEGDSWFDLPGTDVSDKFEELGYVVLSGAAHGDTLENMAFNEQLTQVVNQFRTLLLYNRVPSAILLSVGGNDILGPNLALMLNHGKSSIAREAPIMDNILYGAYSRFGSYIIDYIAAISIMCQRFYQKIDGKNGSCRNIPIIVHGYDYPISTGKGFKILWYLTVAGPWLEPTFNMKNFSPQEAQNTITKIVNYHNEVLRSAVEELHRAEDSEIENPVCYLSLLNTIGKERWADELHPNEAAMEDVAQQFADEIKRCTAQ